MISCFWKFSIYTLCSHSFELCFCVSFKPIYSFYSIDFKLFPAFLLQIILQIYHLFIDFGIFCHIYLYWCSQQIWGPPVRQPEEIYQLLGLSKLSSGVYSVSLQMVIYDRPMRTYLRIWPQCSSVLVLDTHHVQSTVSPARALIVHILQALDTFSSKQPFGSWGERTEVEFGNGREPGHFCQHVFITPSCL